MARKARFVVSLNVPVPTGATVSVAYQTVAGTAVPPSDFTASNGTLTFTAGQQSKNIDVPVREDIPGNPEEQFRVQLSNPQVTGNVTATIASPGYGIAILPGSGEEPELPHGEYVDRFNWIYDNLHDTDNGYFGPQTGPHAFSVPYHISYLDSKIIAEAPDYGGETVSETASFWVGLEAWKGYVSGDWSGYNNAWSKIEQYYIPSATNQPLNSYDPTAPASYIAEGTLPSQYPLPTQQNGPVGFDPLYDELRTTYNTKTVYLMHWIIDVDGAYEFYNADASTQIVYINTFERGMQESSFETITHPCWDDFQNGGGTYGYQAYFTQGTELYGSAPFNYGKKWSYTNAPDAEGRALQWAFWANLFAQNQGGNSLTTIAASQTKAKKMGDYLRYNLFDKYFRVIGNSSVATTQSNPYDACHYLFNWYTAWGGEVPAQGQQSSWGYKVGCSVAHHGYQCVTAAYALATGGGGLTPQSASAGDTWQGSLYRQIEMIRWLQSPEGPIAGGVTNSWLNTYGTPTDGRQNAKFYGMYYDYSPVWHDPPSNDWAGFQCWGHGRTADLFMAVADQDTTLANNIRGNLEIILDRLMVWFMDEIELNQDGSFTVPVTLSWTSDTQVSGQTATTPNLEGVYEYLPTLEWPGTGTPNYAAFWDTSTVPNPNLHCSVVVRGLDLGVASSLTYSMMTYANAKRKLNKFTDPINGSAHTPQDVIDMAKELLDRIWDNYRDDIGICTPETRSDYIRMKDPVYVPSNYTSGQMPNGDAINQSSTFLSMRTFLQSDPQYAELSAYLTDSVNNPAPVFTYHRFWAQVEFAMSNAALHHWFGDIIYD